MTFSSMIQNTIDGKKNMPERNKDLEKAKRKFRSLSKLISDASDPFFFSLDGFKFDFLKCYRGKDWVIIHGATKNRVSIYDMERVEKLGFVRQRKTESGMIDFYTHDKGVKSDRAF